MTAARAGDRGRCLPAGSVGFDLAELAAFVATGWAAWRRRQVLIIFLVVLATLLCCDAWFDVVLDARTAGFELSLLSAVVIELPLAALAGWGARRLLQMNVAVVRRYEGEPGPSPSLWQARLIGGSPGSHLSELFSELDSGDTDSRETEGEAQDRPRDGPAA